VGGGRARACAEEGIHAIRASGSLFNSPGRDSCEWVDISLRFTEGLPRSTVEQMKNSSISCVSIAAVVVSGVFLSSGPASATDWPNWRGPNHDGVSTETDLKMKWPDAGPPLEWQVEGCGKGYSSVAVAAGKIFTIGRKGDAEALIAFSEKDGMELWATGFGTGGDSNGSPTVDGELVYGIGRDGDLVCCEVKTGKKVWSKRFDKDFGGKMMSGWGYSESPLIDGEHLICTPGAKDAMIVALNKKTGEEVWRSAMPDDLGGRGKDGAGYSTVVISNGGGVKQYVQLTGRGLISVDAKDGKFLWSYNAVANDTANIPTPIVEGDYVFASSGYGTGAALLKLSKSDTGVEAKEEYFLDAKTFQNHHGGMLLIDGYIYAGNAHNNGFPVCLKMSNGKIAWGGDERGPGSGSAAITAAGGHLIFRYENGVLGVIEATPKKYNLVCSFKPAYQEGKSWAHPVVANGMLYLREQDKLMCYRLK
jgi:outer membrane protein assembly factor BamB